MPSFLRHPLVARALRFGLVPATGAVYIALWIVAEWSRSLGDQPIVVVILGVAIGLSAWMPATSLGLVVVVPLLQITGLLAPPESTTWPQYLAIAIVAGVVGAGRSDLLRYLTVPAVGVASVAAAWAMTVPTPVRPDVWNSWVASEQGTRSALFTVSLALVGIAGIGWAVGVAVGSAWRLGLARGRLVVAEQQADEASAELQTALDRAAIARDVHDSLAHSLAIVVSQAQGAAALAVRDETAAQALTDIAEVGREALTDVRALVERIEDESPGRHRVDEIGELVEQMREVGMTTSLEVHGQPVDLGIAGESAAYRIVQESCTNALKHAGRRAHVRVVLEWRGPGLAVLVSSRGTEPVVSGVAPGVGIRGMRERARLAGGWLRAGADADAGDGTWTVTAWLPSVPQMAGALPGGAA